jgi:hypothetical protein
LIAGLLVLPWMHEALRRLSPYERKNHYLTDCGKCKKMQTRQTRQVLGCGYEPAIADPRPWSRANLDADWQGKETLCPGYTTSLPEVIEIARARVHWKEGGGLRDFCNEPITEQMRLGVEILEGASNECQGWAMKNPEKK